jgi:uridylate kinase
MASSKLKYKRILLKLSGEALAAEGQMGFDPERLQAICQQIAALSNAGVEVALVIGAGNFMRGAALAADGRFDRVDADHMGMLFTINNGIALRSEFARLGTEVKFYSALAVTGIVSEYQHHKAIRALSTGKIVILGGGTGSPLFSTDSAASLRAIEVGADIILKASTVDGVYDCDPKQNPKAKRYTDIDFQSVLDKQLRVMDLSAFCLCQEHNMPVRVFDLNEKDALMRIVKGEALGTLVSN